MTDTINNNLTVAQQVFAIFYAISFGTMLQSLNSRRSLPSAKENSSRKANRNIYITPSGLDNASLNLFDTPNAWAIGFSKNNKPAFRALLSILILNILPGFIFAVLFNTFGYLKEELSIIQIILLLWLSLAPQWIYRIFYAVLTAAYKSIYITSLKIEKDYNKHDLGALAILWEDRIQFASHRNPYYHLASPIFIYLPSALISYMILMSKIISECDREKLLICSSILLIIGFVFFCIRIKK